jgi:AraC-like DNA-binding protein
MEKNTRFELNTGSYFLEKFDSYDSMIKTSQMWGQICTYQMVPNAFGGEHEFLHLNNILLSHTYRTGSLYYDVVPPADSISIAIIEQCEGKACLGEFKLVKNDIIFIDSIQNFIVNASMKISIISISKRHLRELNLLTKLNSYLNKKFIDHQSLLAHEVNTIFEIFRKEKNSQKKLNYTELEEKIIKMLLLLTEKSTPQKQKFTKGEKIALEIRNNLYRGLDKNMSVTLLATTYNITERTLQKSFLSLFGFSPNYFLRVLKLNHTYKELKESSPKSTTVITIATRWGFSNMGRFSAYYRELFGENPSVTLSCEPILNTNIEDFCAITTEEI